MTSLLESPCLMINVFVETKKVNCALVDCDQSVIIALLEYSLSLSTFKILSAVFKRHVYIIFFNLFMFVFTLHK